MDARLITTNYTYDALNRVTTKSYQGDTSGTPAVSYSYDAQTVPGLPTGAPTFTRGSSTGRLVAVIYGSGNTGTYQGYDQLGRVVQSIQVTETQATGSPNPQAYGFAYSYNLASEMLTETYPSGRVVQTEYDSAGRVAGVRNQGATSYYAGATASDAANRIQYSPQGAVSTMKLGNGKWEHTNFNNRLQPTRIGLGTSGTDSSVLQLDYTYSNSNPSIHDNNGNVLTQTITASKSGGGNLILTQTYSYDPLNRLQVASENGSPAWTQTFDCDRFGNRAVRQGSYIPTPNIGLTPLSANATDFSAFDQSTNRLNKNIQPQTNIDYDNAGNLKKDAAARSLAYDAENRLINFNSGAGQYFYDGDGRRVKKLDSTGTTVFVYNVGGQLIAEYTSGTSSGGGTSYLTSDHLGSTRVVTKQDGSVKARYDYLPFGEEIPSSAGGRSSVSGYSATDSTRQKFTQKERDVESGLDYFLARYYSSAQGRFSSVDPINLTEERLLDPQQINLYVYTRNDPLNLLDPTGATIDFDKDKNGNLTKNGKYSQDLYKKYVEFLNKDSKKYASQLQTIAKLEKSDVNYLVNVTTSELSGSHEAEGRTSTDGTNVLVTIRNIGGPHGEKFSIEGRFAHEFEHGREFDDGEFSFLRVNGNWQANPRDYDIYDEVNAFNAQLGVSAPVNDTPMLRSLRDVRNTEQNRANILKAEGGYTNRGSRPVNTAYGGAKPGELIRPTETSGHDFFGRNHL